MPRCLARISVLAALLGLACVDDREQALVEDCSPSRTMSQPCCPELEIDACGAGLVCAALDGRETPTCYPESSRLDGRECTGDLLCISHSCNSEKDRCEASPGAVCEPDLGCAPDPQGYERKCIDSASGYSCEKVNLPLDSPCTFDRECSSNNCYCGIGTCACEKPT